MSKDIADEIFTAGMICDINMPKMKGVPHIKQLQALENKVSAIFHTGTVNHDLMLKTPNNLLGEEDTFLSEFFKMLRK